MTSPPSSDHQAQVHPRRMRVLFGSLPFASLVVFIIGLALGVRGQDIAIFSLALVTTLVALIPLVLDQRRPVPQRQILLTLFALVYVAHYVTPVFTSYLPASWPIDAPGMSYTNLMPADVVRGQFVALLGLTSLLLGHYALPERLLSRFVPHATREWPRLVVLGIAISMLGLGWAIQIAVALRLVPKAVGTGFLATLGSSLIYGNVLLTYAFARQRSLLALGVLCVTIPVTSALGFFTSSKQSVLITPVVVALTMVSFRRRIRLRWIVVGVLGLALLYPTSEFIRRVILVDNTVSFVRALKNPTATLARISHFVSSNEVGDYFKEGLESTGARVDGLGVTSVLVRDTPRVSPFQMGRTLGLFFAAFVPRGLWPGKPSIVIGQWITDVYGSGPHIRSNTAPTQIGDFFLNFGHAGVIAGMLLLGMFLRVTHEALLKGRPTAAGTLIAVVLLVQLVMRFEANVASMWAGAVFAVVPILVTHLIVRGLTPPTNASGESGHEAFVQDGHARV